ncbi:MAG: FAD-dependent oxidoreductase [Candidatus Atribacteria bacterium]|nr:FAD-dependent oxidoreductase [Candidatus Atribacteria bacterium]MCD6349180.1 FAD-dependent oxidoreductase [Candidatus Atribacteria bacterium]
MSKKVVIIGGVAAGPKVAAKLKRLDPEAEVVILEKGKFLSYAGCGLPYYIGGDIKEQKELMETPVGVMRDPEYFEKMKGVKVYNRTEALRIDRKKKEVEARRIDTGEVFSLAYDYLVLATGAEVAIPPIKAVDLENPDTELRLLDLAHVCTLHGIEDAEAIRWTIREKLAKKAVIIGGGLIGMEMTESLVKSGLEVTIIEVLPEILPILDEDMGILVRRYCQKKGVTVKVGERVERVEGENGTVKRVVTDKGSYETDLLILATGFRPNTSLARKAGLEIGPNGGIKVDLFLRTSDPFIFACGDCVEVENLVCGKSAYMPMGSLANKQGRVVAINIAGGSEAFRGAVNSVIFKLFDYTIARCGLGVRQAKEMGYEVEYALVPAPDRAHYFPGAKRVITKLIVDKQSGKLLGGQFLGEGEVTKSVYAIATALHYGATIEEISNLDVPYAPPYASAIDNICVAANVVRNKLEGKMVGISPLEVERKRKRGEDFLLLDVRTPAEYQKVHIPGSTLIPLGTLRNKLDTLPRDKEIVVFCAVSLRGYEASLILKSAGFENVKVMDGGLACWPYEVES